MVDECRARLCIIWVTSPPSVVQERMLRRQERLQEDDDASDADWLVYLDLRRRAEPIRRPHIVINTAVDYETVFRRLVGQLTSETEV
jgi:predicted kinase